MLATSANALPEALAHHQRGELEQAVRLYRQILEAEPDHADALHLLGVAMLQCGQPQKAIPLIERAIARSPSVADFHNNLAEAYRASGQFQRSAACFQVALRLRPDAVDTSLNFGSMLMQAGRPAEAATLFRQALQNHPNHALAHNNLGNALRQLGETAQAEACYRRAVELSPQTGFLHGNLAQMLLDVGQLQEALHHGRLAVRLEPNGAPAHNNLGNVYRTLGRFEEAKACYIEALRLKPNVPIVYDNVGRVLVEETKYEEAVKAFQMALQLEPNSSLFHRHLGEALTGQHQFADADKHLRIAQTLEPGNPHNRYSIGWMYYEQGRLEEAQAEYRSILREYPNHPIINQHLGEVLIELNQMDEAIACFRTALSSRPKYAPALAKLADMLADKLSADERRALIQLSGDPVVADQDRVPLLYSLAHVCDAEGAFEDAAQHLDRANDLELTLRKQRGQNYNVEAHRRFVDRLIKVFTLEFFQRVQGFGVDSERPVFIVGLPRSGTTLLEQILASHSRLFGAGELLLSRQGFEKLGGGGDGRSEMRAFDALESIDAGAVRGLAQTHLDALHALNRDADRISDKMPDNYLYVGYLTLLFPKARFLHCRRDPRDVAVSCWITQFRMIPWANHPEHLASRFAQYQRVMEHWQRVLPVPVLDVDYEDIVNDLETVARRAIEFCGLDWQPACLEFHRTRRPIRTASATQVRQPLYQRSIARWRNYEQALRPLFKRLERIFALPEAEELEEAMALAEASGDR